MVEIPLFPLNLVLLPGNPLLLKIFEPRYLDMIAGCLREDSPFGVVLIRRGEEVGEPADTCSIGCSARIVDWERRQDGLLGITARGGERFRILSKRSQADGLLLGEVELLDEQIAEEIPDQYYYLLELLDHISAQAGHQREHGQSFTGILFELIYLLPLDRALKQRLLEIDDSHDRAAILHAELIRLGVIQYIKPDIGSP